MIFLGGYASFWGGYASFFSEFIINSDKILAFLGPDEPETKRPGLPGNHKLQTTNYKQIQNPNVQNSKQKEAASLPRAAASNLFDLLSFFCLFFCLFSLCNLFVICNL